MTTEKYDSDNLLVLGLHLNCMIECPGGDVSASRHESFKRRYESSSQIEPDKPRAATWSRDKVSAEAIPGGRSPGTGPLP